MAEIIKLTCPSCGAKLDLTKDVERFACSHCGNEHIVVRRGGIVSLKPVVEALEKVEAGTDRTASELAMARLEKEIYFLRQEMDKPDVGRDVMWLGAVAFGLIAGLSLCLVIAMLRSISERTFDSTDMVYLAFPTIIALITGAIARRLWRAQKPDKAWTARKRRLKAQLDAKIAEYQKHRGIVEAKE